MWGSTIIRSNSIETICPQKILSSNVKYITHMQSIHQKEQIYTFFLDSKVECHRYYIYHQFIVRFPMGLDFFMCVDEG